MEKIKEQAAEQHSSYIELTISCRKLRNLDTLSLTDAQCRVFEWNSGLNDWKCLGQTET